MQQRIYQHNRFNVLRYLVVVAFGGVAGLWGTVWAGGAPVIRPDLPLIFPDDHLISAKTNLVRVFHQAKKDPGIALNPDRKWEKGCCGVYGSVNRMDDGH